MSIQSVAPLTVVMPVWNIAGVVRWNRFCEALHGLREQTVRPAEVIVVDDGSDDDTPDRLLRVTDSLVLRLPERRGPNFATNRGAMLARTTYLLRHDADDFSEPTRIEAQLCVMAETNLPVSVCNYKVRHKDGSLTCGRDKLPPIGNALDLEVHGGYYHDATFLWETAFFRELEGYQERVKYVDGRDMRRKLEARKQAVAYVAESLYVYNTGNDPLQMRNLPEYHTAREEYDNLT